MDYWPNIDGVVWFVNEALPILLEEYPDLLFYIVGSNPSHEVQKLKSKRGVVVTGFVEDVRDYLAIADVSLIPLRIARGIQNKVLESMAMGKAIVCSPQSIEGIKARSGRDFLLGDDGKAFALSVSKLLSSGTYKDEIGKQARCCVENNYSWDANLSSLERILEV